MRRPKHPPPLATLFAAYPAAKLLDLVSGGAGHTPPGRYLHWDQLKYRQPPDGLNHEQWWLAIKLARVGGSRALPLFSKSGAPFAYTLPDFLQETLHRVDQDASGRIEIPSEVANPHTRDRYLISHRRVPTE